MRALISVSDKRGLISFVKELVEIGYEIISTGGTLKVLKENQISATPVDEVTEFPEIMNGRVKTLHPKIHGGLLADRSNKAHMETAQAHHIHMIDLVVVNLYPFEQTVSKPNVSVEDAIENIDIGGPSMIRSGAKNFKSVGVVVNPDRYGEVLADLKANGSKLSDGFKKDLASEAFQHTAQYDTVIARYFGEAVSKGPNNGFPQGLSPVLTKVSDLRYGENPHQKAAFYKLSEGAGLPGFRKLHGKELSYNNIMDLEAAWQIVKEFDIPGAAVIKHTNPCGAAVAHSLAEAYRKAFDADPSAAFGSIVALNRSVDKKTADLISKTFVEVVVAPQFEKEAVEILSQKPSLRLIELPHFDEKSSGYGYKYVSGGFLVQTQDSKVITKEDLSVVTDRKPTAKEINDLLFAFTLVKFVKSNAILIAKDGQTMGVGAGQMSRVEATEIALQKAGKKAEGAVLASDAFLPFKDTVEKANEYKIKAIIQPGGSKRDQESIDACNDYGIVMVFTGVRHFKH